MGEISKSETTIRTTKYTLYKEDIKRILGLEDGEIVHTVYHQKEVDTRSKGSPFKIEIMTEKEIK